MHPQEREKGCLTKVPENRSQTPILAVLEQLGAKLTKSEAFVTLAALIYLRWLDFQEGEQEAIAAFEGASYTPALPSELHWRSWFDQAPVLIQDTLGHQLPKAMQGINTGDNPLMAGFPSLSVILKQLGRTDADLLAALVHCVAEQTFETPGDRRQVLELFDEVPLYDSIFESGGFRTPRFITTLVAALANPSPGDRIYDPCFGLAEFLTASKDFLQNKNEKLSAQSLSPTLDVYGVERNLNALVIGMMRLALAGVDFPHLELGDSLERTPPANPERDGFDVAVLNPPWGGRVKEEVANHFPVPSKDTTSLFLQHALMHLRPGSLAIILVPESLLSRGGYEKQLRKMLAQEHTVEAIIGLPTGVFAPHTSMRISIVLVRRGGQTASIRMVDASAYFESKGQHTPLISPKSLDTLRDDITSEEDNERAWSISLDVLAELDWDFTPRHLKNSALMNTIDILSKKIQVAPLSKCCEILSGQSVRSEHQTDIQPKSNPLPIIRIRDIQRGEASQAKCWLTQEGISSFGHILRLKAGDVLISKSGTIGKVGIVRNGAVGGVPTTGLYVLRPNLDILDPHYLVACLESPQIWAWLEERSRRDYIRYHPKSIIDSLPLPLAPLPIQKRVVEECRSQEVDALVYLKQLLANEGRDQIAEWVENVIREMSQTISNPLDFSPLERIAHQVADLRNKALHGTHTDSPLVNWLLTLYDGASKLQGISNVPKGSGLLSLLQDAKQDLENAKAALRGHLPAENRARTLNDLTTALIQQAKKTLLADISLVLTTDEVTLKVGEMGAIILQLRNEGSLPLRDIRVSTKPDWGEKDLGYLEEGNTIGIPLIGPTPKLTGKFTLLAEWSARTLDGQEITGEREIAFDVIEETGPTTNEDMQIAASPYICGDPISPGHDSVFFGRENLLEQIRRQVVMNGNVVLLEGNRRSGKSSILRHLEGRTAIPGWLGVYCSLQGAEGSTEKAGVPTVEVFRVMAGSIARAVQALEGETPLPNRTTLAPGKKLGISRACRDGIGESAPFSDFRDYIEVILELLATHELGLLLMLDEFDKLQEGIDSGITSPQTPENIRYLIQTYPKFSSILTGSRRLKRLREEYWSALFGLGTRFSVTALEEADAARLVTEPVQGRLVYAPEAVKQAILLTTCQPYLLQCLCSRIFDMAVQLKTRSITFDFVEKAAKALVIDNEHFASLWDYINSDRRRFILALCHNQEFAKEVFNLGRLQELLYSHGINVDDETLITDLELLIELELLELHKEQGGEQYAPAVPLMGDWINHQQDFSALKKRAQMETEDQHD